nr:immunoglobulin heavy chain junction region [Macaca mulatta]MOY22890.1 immunoglobulin heavy chain junction region [Macaca mulatta]MOY23322.1 immunoglobulin heavy chain junction region [Macaca mulatta]MOY24335.1 immunoglobulin heavy chain junction region [Macaca mulatta]MOY26359.1 immunoglobulin heavy chain junction region [Macaca mulatta]
CARVPYCSGTYCSSNEGSFDVW